MIFMWRIYIRAENIKSSKSKLPTSVQIRDVMIFLQIRKDLVSINCKERVSVNVQENPNIQEGSAAIKPLNWNDLLLILMIWNYF